MTFDVHKFSSPANPDDGVFTEDARTKLNQILESVEGAKFMKLKEGALGLTGNKYFVWKNWGPIAWWDIVERDKLVLMLTFIF